MDKLIYKIDVFEGPLDMLLALIAKNKLNIYDIPISQLLEQYLEQIEVMRGENMEVASEFLEMAARLVYIKSLSLLPKHEEEEGLRRELTGQLIEYRLCKLAASTLAELVSFDRMVREPVDIPVDNEYKLNHEPREILSALIGAWGKSKRLLPPNPETFSEIVAKKIVSVASQTVFLLRRLWRAKSVTFRSLFVEKREKSERVAAFLALLELVKGNRVRMEGDGENMKIKLIKGGERR